MAIPANYLEIKFSNKFFIDLQHRGPLPFADSPPYQTNVKEYRVLSEGDDVKRVYEVTLNLKDIKYDYKPGDSIGIIPENNHKEVDELINRLNYNAFADTPYSLTILKDTVKKKPIIPPHLPIHSTIRNVFMHFVDIRSVPKKLFIRSLHAHTTDERDRNVIDELCDVKASQRYNEFIANEGKTLYGLLNALPSCNPPIERLFEHLPALLPRYYSIASSPLIGNELKFAFAVIEMDDYKGVCTGWMEDLLTRQQQQQATTLEDDVWRFYFRKASHFLTIPNPLAPLLLIGPGTGVAPFVGLLQHRQLLNTSHSYGDTFLFYGCRYSKKDFLYELELKDYLDGRLLSGLFTAFSREQEKKIYVQDRILKNGEMIADLLANDMSIVCVCGDGKNMAKCVEDALIKCLIDHKRFDDIEAKQLLTKMKKSNRYQLDLWI